MRLHDWPWISAAGLSALALAPVQIVVAAEYLSITDAQRAMFAQADRFEAMVLKLSSEQLRAIAQLAGPQPPHRSLQVWRAMHGAELLGHFFVDEVIGRHDFITYAIAIDAAGKLSAIEVLSYRESHGGEIRNAAWRRQFNGRQRLEQLRFRTDIKNIAGATLSCEHVTQGVRWLIALWQTHLRASTNPS